jgi:hypothetical protein
MATPANLGQAARWNLLVNHKAKWRRGNFQPCLGD